jgi:hypothetical protein
MGGGFHCSLQEIATKAEFHLYTTLNGYFRQFCVDEKGRGGVISAVPWKLRFLLNLEVS